jgi:hypothetical protein
MVTRQALKSLLKKTRSYHFLFLAVLFCPFIASCQSASDELTVVTRTLSFDTPSGGWSIQAIAAYRVANEDWCFHQLTPPDGPSMQMISKISGKIRHTGTSKKRPVKHFVLGKTWAWSSNPEIKFIKSMDSLKEALADAEPLALISE